MIQEIRVILVFGLLILSATAVIITAGEESSKIQSSQRNITEIIKTLSSDRSELSYNPESHDFGNMYEGETDSTIFEIWNSGCCQLIYNLAWNCSWVDVDPTDGSSSGEHDFIYVDIDTTGLEWGPYTCNISILSNSGNGVFTVTLYIINEDFIDISIGEAWELLNDTANGIQTPIDVRTNEEWIDEHIDTPFPENPRHHPLSDLQNETKLQEFMELYKDSEIMLYCKSGVRSEMATQILVDNKFNGKIYNILGGITAWVEAGYPTKSDLPPYKPVISGPTTGEPGIKYDYTFNATDLEGDVYYYIEWGDGEIVEWIGPYKSGEAVTLNHTWSEQGTYNITAKAKDIYDLESEWSDLFIVNITQKAFFIGLITNMNSNGNITTFNAKLLFCVRLMPFDSKFYSSEEKIMISNQYVGRIRERFIIGTFDAVIV